MIWTKLKAMLNLIKTNVWIILNDNILLINFLGYHLNQKKIGKKNGKTIILMIDYFSSNLDQQNDVSNNRDFSYFSGSSAPPMRKCKNGPYWALSNKINQSNPIPLGHIYTFS